MIEEKIWAEKYRPQKIEDIVLSSDIKNIFKGFVADKFIPNLILAGPSGTGKTTVARAAINEIGAESFLINGSLKNGIDTLRYDIANFAASVSMYDDGRKYIIVDEADWLTVNAQAAYRGFIEEFSSTCSFIFTCNYKNKIFKELHSRFHIIDFITKKEEKPKLAMEFFKRVEMILDEEGVEYEKRPVAEIVQKRFPDFRKTLVDLQAYYIENGKIDVGIIDKKTTGYDTLFQHIKNKSFDDIKKWVSSFGIKDYNEVYKEIYENGLNYIEKSSIPNFVIILANYSYKHSFVIDQEINLVAFLTEIMLECDLK